MTINYDNWFINWKSISNEKYNVPHEIIHKRTWSPDGKYTNQIDNILINMIFDNYIKDIWTLREADSDLDHWIQNKIQFGKIKKTKKSWFNEIGEKAFNRRKELTTIYSTNEDKERIYKWYQKEAQYILRS